MSFAANLSEKNIRRFLEELKHMLTYKFRVAHYLLERSTADLLMIHEWGVDRIQHELWNLFDETHPKYNRALGEKFKGEIINYFSLVDQEIGKLWESFGKENPIMIISDHGFGPVHKCVDLNCFLLKEGFIKIKKNPLSQLKYLAWKQGLTYQFLFNTLFKGALKAGLNLPVTPPLEGIKFFQGEGRQLLLSFNDVDWSRTVAYSKFGIGTVHINLQGREMHGVVEPGEEYDRVRKDIVERLRHLRDPETGQKIEGDIFLREEIYHGEHLDYAPDIVFLTKGTYLAGTFVGFTSNKPVVDNQAWSGNHRINGIFLARGEGIEKGKRIEGAKIIDIAPTVLYLMGEKIPFSMDGKVLDRIFSPKFLESNPKEFYHSSLERGQKDTSFTLEDEDDIVKRLKGLGYL
jgi:predicted AlkP superfamily phosphohydrolase/phosphomutase